MGQVAGRGGLGAVGYAGGGGIRLGSEMAEHARVVELQQPYAIYERTSSHFLY